MDKKVTRIISVLLGLSIYEMKKREKEELEKDFRGYDDCTLPFDNG